MAVKYSQEPKYKARLTLRFLTGQIPNHLPNQNPKQKLPVSEDLHHWLCETHVSIHVPLYTFKLSKQSLLIYI